MTIQNDQNYLYTLQLLLQVLLKAAAAPKPLKETNNDNECEKKLLQKLQKEAKNKTKI